MAQQDKTWESAWKSALENKSLTPPDGVWENIEGELHQKASRKIAPWWWAAAAIATVLAAGGLLLNEVKIEGDISDASETNMERNIPNHKGNDEASTPARANTPVEGDNEDGTGGVDAENNKEQSFSQNGILNTTVFEEAGLEKTRNDKSAVNKVDKPHEVYDFLPSLLENINAKLSELTLPEIPELWGVPTVNLNPTEKEELSDSWFAGIDYSTGSASADGMISSGGNLQYTNNDGAAGYNSFNSTSETSSITAYGMTVGKKITNKIVVESGITYRRIENSGMSNLAFSSPEGKATFNANADLFRETITTTSPYEVRNVHQFVSIPVKAGYLILDKKWKMSLNAGVSGDYFFQTHTEDLSGNLGRYETTPSDNPNWNSMIMSAVGGMNMSRVFADHYIIAISPEVRQALGDFSNTHQELKPFIIQVGVKLQYKF